MTTREKLTPEAVAGMSDADLSQRLAEVLGFEWTRGVSDALVWWNAGGKVFKSWELFLPSHPVAVDHVREHMRERCCEWQFETVGRERWVARILPPGFSGAQRAVTATLGRATFEAATLAAQEMEGRTNVDQVESPET